MSCVCNVFIFQRASDDSPGCPTAELMGALPAASGVSTWRAVGCAFTLMLFCAAHHETRQSHVVGARHQE